MVGFAKTQSEVMSVNVSLASLVPTVKLTSMNVNLVSAQQIWNVLMVLEHISVSADQVTQALLQIAQALACVTVCHASMVVPALTWVTVTTAHVLPASLVCTASVLHYLTGALLYHVGMVAPVWDTVVNVLHGLQAARVRQLSNALPTLASIPQSVWTIVMVTTVSVILDGLVKTVRMT